MLRVLASQEVGSEGAKGVWVYRILLSDDRRSSANENGAVV